MPSFDHLAISAATLSEGAALVEAQLGHVIGPGGNHTRMGTHNRLSGLGPGEYLEVIAINPDAEAPDGPRWFDLDRRAGAARVGNWIARCEDLDAAIADFPDAGRPIQFERGEYRWRMAVPEDGVLPFDGCFPALIEWQSGPPAFEDTGLRLEALMLRHPKASELREILHSLVPDPRIVVTEGDRWLSARIETPDGTRVLS
ncbi:VOC family protein [uncultured Jannaschia sp.]|uniref:VOC family protein n=1 Tax=uncultured Jannaschia sp. TaxID=293347 RepID=UPI002637439C|nr:VOC family protein [uncultured Jannaschia sp.]